MTTSNSYSNWILELKSTFCLHIDMALFVNETHSRNYKQSLFFYIDKSVALLHFINKQFQFVYNISWNTHSNTALSWIEEGSEINKDRKGWL